MSNPDKPTTTPPEPLRVIGLRVSNYKRLVALDLQPDGRAVVLGGRNASGKSSTLDAIADALGGKRRGAGTEVPLRSGAVRGEVRVDLGAAIVTRRWSPTSDALTVEAPPGSPIKSPQAWLDRVLGDLAFDPLAFARQDARAQAETLRRLSGLDTREIDERRAKIYAERTAANAEVKRARLAREQVVVGAPPPAAPPRPVLGELLARRDGHRATIAANKAARASAQEIADALDEVIARRAGMHEERASLARDHEALDRLPACFATIAADAERWRITAAAHFGKLADAIRSAELAAKGASETASVELARAVGHLEELRQGELALDKEIRTLEAKRAASLQEIAHLVDPTDEEIADAERALREADAATAAHEEGRRKLDVYNAAVRLQRERVAELQAAEGRADQLDAEIKALDEQRLAAIAAARMPIEGLALDGDAVLYRGVPFAQASQAEQVRVGVAIGAALNPTLRVVLVREGAFLDDESLRAVIAAAESHGLQPWIEVVGDREGVGVIIDDGRVLADRLHGEVAP